MSRNATALQTDFDSPEEVSEVYRDPLPADDDAEFEDDEPDDLIFMIEQEYCFVRDDRQHLYLNGAMHCCACGAAHPSIRKACGQR